MLSSRAASSRSVARLYVRQEIRKGRGGNTSGFTRRLHFIRFLNGTYSLERNAFKTALSRFGQPFKKSVGHIIGFIGGSTDIIFRQCRRRGGGRVSRVVHNLNRMAAFLRRLFRIAQVRPQDDPVRRDDKHPFTARKAAEITEVLRLQQNGGSQSTIFEKTAQRLYSFFCHCITCFLFN